MLNGKLYEQLQMRMSERLSQMVEPTTCGLHSNQMRPDRFTICVINLHDLIGALFHVFLTVDN